MENLVWQVKVLETFCVAKAWMYYVIDELGSGLNSNKKWFSR
jgi:predicted site-specific integrase-resolvase